MSNEKDLLDAYTNVIGWMKLATALTGVNFILLLINYSNIVGMQ